MKVLHQDFMRMLRTRFVLLVENSMIRRYSITKHSWMTSTVFPGDSCKESCSLRELTDFTIRMFKRMCQKHCGCQVACLCLVSWILLRKQRDRLILLQRSPSHHQVFPLLAQLQVVPPRHRVSRRVHQGGLLRKVEPILEPSATSLPALGHCNWSPDAWVGTSSVRGSFKKPKQVAHDLGPCLSLFHL